MRRTISLLALALAFTGAGGTALAHAATVTVVNLDGPDQGFNDPSPRAPIGGNTGTTLGQQRLNAFQFAADIWGANLNSAVEIRVGANFEPLPCNSTSAVLGEAGPNDAFHDFAGAPVPNTWYPQALANKLAGRDLSPWSDDIGALFNSTLGTTCSFPGGWYYGLDGHPPANSIDLVTVLLHEIGHGLGFLTFVDDATGQKMMGLDDAFMRNLEDHRTGKTYPQMTDSERAAAAVDTGNLHWVGASVVAASGAYTGGVGPGPHMQMYAPSRLQPGSSVSHWSDAVTPNDLMEPIYTGPLQLPGLTAHAFADIGWSPLSCGNSRLDVGEECDDGNLRNGDGCNAVCEIEPCWTCLGAPSICSPQTGSACDDRNPCTQNDTCNAGVCAGSATPLTGCRQPFVPNTAFLVLKDTTPDGRDRLTWRWLKGTATSAADFGDPVLGSTAYDLCVYDQNGITTQVKMRHHIPAGIHWTQTRTGFKYADRTVASNGIGRMTLRADVDGKAKILVSGHGTNLNMTALPLEKNPKVIVQISNGSVCWEAQYSTSLRNDSGKFKAKAD